MNTSLAPGSVVVGVDGSPGSDLAVEWAAAHAAAHRRPLVIVHGTGYLVVTDFGYALVEAREALRTSGRRIADAALALALETSPGLQATTQVTTADPRELLAETAAEGSLLVLGARGHGPIADLLLGSVSTALIAQPPCPVVVARAAPSAATDVETLPVVVGIDGTDASAGAIGFAFETASWQHRPLEVLYVLDAANANPYIDLFSEEQVREFRAQFDLRVAETLAGYAEKFPDVTVHTRLSLGSVAGTLRDASESACVVVVGTRGGGPLARRLLGSVSRSVAERGHCTVAVIPGGAS